ATATSMNSTEGHVRTFRCADMGNTDCRWETSATSDEEIVEQARMHAQTQHGWEDWTDAMRDRVRDAIASAGQHSSPAQRKREASQPPFLITYRRPVYCTGASSASAVAFLPV